MSDTTVFEHPAVVLPTAVDVEVDRHQKCCVLVIKQLQRYVDMLVGENQHSGISGLLKLSVFSGVEAEQMLRSLEKVKAARREKPEVALRRIRHETLEMTKVLGELYRSNQDFESGVHSHRRVSGTERQ